MSSPEKDSQWQQEALMERIRSHASQRKNYTELAKAMRMGLLEKRFPIDAVEKSNLQKCLDSMQECITVHTREGLVERLESLSRQLGLKFMDDAKALFISTDMFFLEIILDSNGDLMDVKVHHECKVEQQSCSELVNCLNRGDFADFTAQLEGFSSIYQLNAEPKVKTKAYDAMMAMETDLYSIYEKQNSSNDISTILKESTVGYVIKRAGGHPMRLVYFVSPFDLICKETQTIEPPAMETFKNKKMGFSVTVNLEAASATKLQILPTVSFVKNAQTGVEMPVFGPLTQMNSLLLPATFVLKLNKPLPVCYNAYRLLGVCRENSATLDNSNNAGSLETQHRTSIAISHIINLTLQTATGESYTEKPFIVSIPDQTHWYYFIENTSLKATLISSVQFTEPSQVPKILAFLKKHAIFHALLCSCIRPKSKMPPSDYDSAVIAEISVVSFQQITVTIQDSNEGSIIAIEFYLRDGNVQCKIYSLHNDYEMLSMKLTNIAQTCLSIPITIRAFLKHWKQDHLQLFQCPTSGGPSGTNTPITLTNNLCSSFVNSAGVGSSTNDTINGLARACNSNIEQNGSQRMQQATSYASYRAADLNEDFYDSPKGLSIQNINEPSMEAEGSGEISTLGQQQQLQVYEQSTAAITNREIADKYKNIWKEKASTKNCVSITPLNNQGESSANSSLDVQRTGGIEIIPLISQAATDAVGGIATNKKSIGNSSHGTASTSTITITPINSTSSGNNKEKTASTSGLLSPSPCSSPSSKRPVEVAEVHKEKKRKKKRDDSPMGPPETVLSRQNSPASCSESNTNAVVRKFPSPSSSPKPTNSGLLPSTVTVSSVSAKPSPKHSPVYSSPKHSTTLNSPKSPFGTLSPKHGPSGKPSMSTLKSATVASPKGDKTSGAITDTNLTSSSLSTSALVRSAAAPSVNTTSTSNTLVAAAAAMAAAAAAAIATIRNKDKPNTVTSPVLGASTPPSATSTVKSNMGVASMQQMKNVPGLNHIGSGFNNVSQASASLDMNSVTRKGVGAAFEDVDNKYGGISVNNPSTVPVNANPASNVSSSWQQ